MELNVRLTAIRGRNGTPTKARGRAYRATPDRPHRDAMLVVHGVRGNGTAEILQLFGSQRGASIQDDYTSTLTSVEYIVIGLT